MSTLTSEQAAAIVAKWNELANEANQLTAEQAHLVFHDNSDEEMAVDGCTQIEVSAARSRTGKPASFYITEEEITAE